MPCRRFSRVHGWTWKNGQGGSPALGCLRQDGRVRRGYWSWSTTRPPASYSILLPDNPPQLPDLSLIPEHILKPEYAASGEPGPVPRLPVIWSDQQIEKIRRSCALARQALDLGASLVLPGVTTATIDQQVRQFILDNGAYPSPFNFKGFPKSISCSVNNVAVHGIPDQRALQEGDIINIDVTVFLDGFHGDCSDTFPVGEVDEHAAKLMNVTRDCLGAGIGECRDGALYRNIGQTIHTKSKQHQLSSIQILVGHGIGTFFHGPPDIYHCLNSYPGKMREGMVFTIEPCLSEGDRRLRFLRDGWTAVTMDNARTAQAEHTVLITAHGAEVLTR